jgi:hypothetical protein
LGDLVEFEGFFSPLFNKTLDWRNEQLFFQFAFIRFINKTLKRMPVEPLGNLYLSSSKSDDNIVNMLRPYRVFAYI